MAQNIEVCSLCMLRMLMKMKSCFEDFGMLVLNVNLSHCSWGVGLTMGHIIVWDTCLDNTGSSVKTSM